MKFAVIGAGAAGCAATYTLSKQGHEVQLFEGSDSIGGRTKHVMRDGFSLPSGALFLMEGLYPRATQIVKETGHQPELIPWGGETQLIDHENSRFRVNFVRMLSYLSLPVLRLSDKLRLLRTGVRLMLSPAPQNPFNGADLVAFDKGENVEEWSRRNLGDVGFDYIMRPMMDFLTAVPSNQLATAFPLAMVQNALKIKLSVPPKGMGQICDWMIEASRSARVLLSTKVARVDRRGPGYSVVTQAGEVHDVDGVVFATEAFESARLMNGFLPESPSGKLVHLRYAKYATVSLAYKKNPWPDFPADMVLPAGKAISVNCLVLNSRRQPDSVPNGGELVTVYFTSSNLETMDDDDIRRESIEVVNRVFGPAPDPDFVHMFVYPRGISVSSPGMYRIMDSVHGELPPGIQLAGDYFANNSVETAISSGERAGLALHKMSQTAAIAN